MQSTWRDRVVRSRIPPWADPVALRAIERERRRLSRITGMSWSIDHIVPLNHPLVCGLHTPANLALVPMVENLLKGNRWWPDMPDEQIPLFDEGLGPRGERRPTCVE